MEEVIVSKETYDKMVNILIQIPYGQISGLLSEVAANTRAVEKDAGDAD